MAAPGSTNEKALKPPRGIPGKPRHKFSKKDLEILKQTFEQNPYPDFTTREELSKQIGCALSVIDTWFQNKRARLSRSERQRIIAQQRRHRESRQGTWDLGPTAAQAPVLLGQGSCCPLETPKGSCQENAGTCDPAVQGTERCPRCALERQGEIGSGPSSNFSSSSCLSPSISEPHQQLGLAGWGEKQCTPPFISHYVQSAQGAAPQPQPQPQEQPQPQPQPQEQPQEQQQQQQQEQQQQQQQQQTHDGSSSRQGEEQYAGDYFQQLAELWKDAEEFVMSQDA